MIIDKTLTTSFDHELIVFDMGNLDEMVSSTDMRQEVTGWAIRVMCEEETEIAQKC